MSTDVDRLVQRALRDISAKRQDLTDEDMMGIISPEAQLVGQQKFPNGLLVWFFAVKGVLRGNMLTGCTFRGSCALVMAPNERQAKEWAEVGLRDTIEALRSYHLSTPDPRPMASTVVVAGGRKTTEDAPPLIERNPRLHEHLHNRFNKTRH